MLKKFGYEKLMEDNNCIVWFYPRSSVTLTFWKHSGTVSIQGLHEPYDEFDINELKAIINQLERLEVNK
ncbi:hypothetical protein [Priestia megaterium]|uniref:hypothetical protein n=1 Tax=Priestia megaterium TaxID=1404 RepID=UPI002E247A61|nr:hypothetical protein [Priestia megaterium]